MHKKALNMQETSSFALQLHFLPDLRIWNDFQDPDLTNPFIADPYLDSIFLIIPDLTHITKLTIFCVYIEGHQENL